MTNQEILTKAIEKAIANGWKGSPYLDYTKIANDQYLTNLMMGEGVWLTTIVYCPPHDFAKALWGDTYAEGVNGGYPLTRWKARLQQMVVDPDPIQYLGENL